MPVIDSITVHAAAEACGSYQKFHSSLSVTFHLLEGEGGKRRDITAKLQHELSVQVEAAARTGLVDLIANLPDDAKASFGNGNGAPSQGQPSAAPANGKTEHCKKCGAEVYVVYKNGGEKPDIYNPGGQLLHYKTCSARAQNQGGR